MLQTATSCALCLAATPVCRQLLGFDSVGSFLVGSTRGCVLAALDSLRLSSFGETLSQHSLGGVWLHGDGLRSCCVDSLVRHGFGEIPTRSWRVLQSKLSIPRMLARQFHCLWLEQPRSVEHSSLTLVFALAASLLFSPACVSAGGVLSDQQAGRLDLAVTRVAAWGVEPSSRAVRCFRAERMAWIRRKTAAHGEEDRLAACSLSASFWILCICCSGDGIGHSFYAGAVVILRLRALLQSKIMG